MKSIINILIFLFSLNSIYSQCNVGTTTPYPAYDVSTVNLGARATMVCCLWGNEHIVLNNIVAGNTYTFDTCGATSNTMLTLFDPTDTSVAFNDNSCTGGGGLISNFVATVSGTYKIQINTPSCGGTLTNTAVAVTAVSTLGISNFETDSQVLKIYPNPSLTNFLIKTSSPISNVELYSQSGKHVKTFDRTQEFYEINELETGIYFVKIYTDKTVVIKKLIKQ